MRTRSKSYPNNSNATIPRRSNRRRVPNIVEPEIRTIEEVVPMADRNMEELLQAPTEGYREAIIIPEILAEIYEIKTNLLQLVQTNKFYSFERDNPHTHISNFKRMTSTLKYRDVPNDAIKLMLFLYSLEGAARIWYEKEPPNSILTWDDLVNKFVNQFFPPSKTTHLKNEISRFTQSSKRHLERLGNDSRKCLEHVPTMDSQTIEKTCVICGGAHAYYDCIAIDSNQPSVCAATGTYNQVSLTNRASNQIPPPGFTLVQNNQIRGDFNKQEENLRRNLNNDMRSILGSFFQNQASTSGTLLSNIVSNPKGEMKAVTTRSGLAYEGPSILTNSPFEKVVERETEEITDTEHPSCQGSTAHIQPSVVPISILEPDVPKTQPKPNIPYPSRLNDQKLREKATNQMEKCIHALADLGASINLMPLSIWKKLSLPELTPTWMTLELVDRSITRPKGVAEDVFLKVGKFHFPTNFVVVDFEADPRVPLILGRYFLRTGRALIDVYGEEITLRVNDKFITFNLNQTMRYSLTYDDNYVNRVDVINIAYEEFVQDVLDFLYNSKSSNPTLVFNPSFFKETKSEFCKEPIVKSSSPTLTPFGESDFFLEEIEDFLKDESIPTGIKNSFYDLEGDILYLEKLLNDDPFQLPLMDLKQAEATTEKSSIEEPPELELKELPSHLEYAFLEDTDKLPVIIAKDLKDVEKEALIKVLKSRKRAIAWKIFDIKGIDPRFYTHKILMEEDYKPVVQSQRRPVGESHTLCAQEGCMTVVANENNELIPTRLVTGWRVCINYRKLNDATRKDHFPLPFMDQMLERLVGNEFYCILDGFSRYFQISIDLQDQEKTTFTCPYGTFAYRRMPFGLCNALDKILKRCEDTNLVLNWEKCHFMCKEGIIIGHKISKSRIEVDRAKADDIAKLPHPTTVKGVRSFLGHAGFYRRFIQDFSKIARPMTHLLEKETPFVFSKDCVDAFETLKKKLTEASILVVPDWNLPFERMCDASDFTIGVVLGQRSENLAADHLSRLENTHKDVMENKDINENFPLETLGSLSSRSTSWLKKDQEKDKIGSKRDKNGKRGEAGKCQKQLQ
nr:DNA-directed DNA polymerase [Tanacetum cinerariifolium]